jgi:thiol-disulfide isomerase/thioredoxin
VRARATAAWVVAGLMVLTGCGAAPAAQGGFVGGDGSLTIVAPDQRTTAPQITGELLGGGTFDSATLSGQVVVYNVWGSWCAPCRKEAPALEAAARRTAGRATFVGLNTRDLDQAPAQAFVRAFDITYPSVFDPDGRELLKFGTDLPPSAIPSTLVVDAQGRIAARVLGEVTEATLVGLVDDVAAGK